MKFIKVAIIILSIPLFILVARFSGIYLDRAIIMNKKINFYGKLIDQNGLPVTNAIVKLHTQSAAQFKDYVLVTDNNGLFKLENKTGFLVTIDSFNKDGYDGDFHYWVKNGMIDIDSNYKPDPNNPIIYKIRKKEPPTVVNSGKMGISPNEFKSNKILAIEILRHYARDPRRMSDGEYNDIFVTTTISKDAKLATINFEMVDTDNGIIELPELLYVPPESGYLKKYSISIGKEEVLKKYLYVKARGGKLYARMESTVIFKGEYPYFEARILTNLLGERNFEEDPLLLQQYYYEKTKKQ